MFARAEPVCKSKANPEKGDFLDFLDFLGFLDFLFPISLFIRLLIKWLDAPP
jgi:hypothetical protein